ncbi:Protein of unknown function [Cotesia congregata]|uniref:Uncharacterized protein n=1 Tax=Cotesia congregata TaxID=51543 RepID=A0A8J2H9D8_COTCN|nr:Protein of unknown function [Cotesia congregata]
MKLRVGLDSILKIIFYYLENKKRSLVTKLIISLLVDLTNLNLDPFIPDFSTSRHSEQDILKLFIEEPFSTTEENYSSSENDYEDSSSTRSDELFFDCDSSHTSDIEDDSSSNSDESVLDEDNLNEPLYPGAPLSFQESLLSILLLTIRHKISDVLLSDILLLISAHCIEPNLCLNTEYKFKQYFDRLGINFDRHFYCPRCHHSLPSECSTCSNGQHVTDKDSSAPYFITTSIIS